MESTNNILNFLGDFEVFFQGRTIRLLGYLIERNGNIILECRTNNETADLFQNNDPCQIYGTVAGTYVTLLDCYVTSSFYIGFGDDVGMLSITPSEIVLGRSSQEEIKVTTISSNMIDLNKLLLDNVFKASSPSSNENLYTFQYRFPKELTAVDKDGKLRVGRRLKESNDMNCIELQIMPYVSFTFNTPAEVHKAMAKIASVRNLFAFFADYYLPLNELSFGDEETTKEYSDGTCDCEIILNYVENIQTPDIRFLVNSNAFEGSFQKIWDNWQSFSKKNEHISALFYEMISNHSRNTNCFLNLCQCLEVYSNHFRNVQAAQIRDTYPKNRGNQITLKHRLEDLFLHINQYLMLPKEKCIELATTISRARNFFTHYNEKKYSEPSFNCIAYSCEFLHFVLLLIVYKTVGIPDEYILDCKKQSEYKNMDFFIKQIT